MRATVKPIPARMVETVKRFNKSQRIEHYLIIVSFTALAITGVPQKYSTWGWASWMINDFFGGIEFIRAVHHFFAYFLVAESIYHVLALGASIARGQMRRIPMLPHPRDIFEFFGQIGYYVGLSKHPRYDRYSYKEKFEYWAIIWGTAIMILTGFMLLFPEMAARVVPGSWIPAAKAAHGGEAVLAVLAIVTWHFYNVHFNPKIFPFDSTIFTGNISKKRMREEHPREFERLFGREDEQNLSMTARDGAEQVMKR